MTSDGNPDGAKVQSAQEIHALSLRLLELELRNPVAAVAIGGPLCWAYAIEDAVAVLRQTEIEGLLGRFHEHEQADIIDAAQIVFAAVEDHLRGFATNSQPVTAHTYPWRLQVMAKNSLFDLFGSSSRVRGLQDEATGGQPLTVCFGRSNRLIFEAALGVRGLRAKDLHARAIDAIALGTLARLPGVSWSHGDGCACAHFESTSRQRLFTFYCRRCASLTGNRQRALERRFWAMKEGRAGGRGIARCACGNEFESTRPNQTRCAKCRRQHRVTVPTRTS